MSEREENSGGSERRRVKRKSQGSGSLYNKREELLKEMQVEEGGGGHIGVRDQLTSLENRGKSDLPDEEKWGSSSSRKKSNQWMLWAILGLAIPVFCLGMLILVKKGNEGALGDNGNGLDFDELSGVNQVLPEDWFVANSTAAFDQAVDILDKLSEPDLTLEGVKSVVRSAEQAERVIDWSKVGGWAGFDTREPLSLTWEYGSSGDAGFITLMGPRADYSDFRAYFIRNNEELRLDVDATEGYSEVPVVEIAGKSLESPVLMRVWVAKEPHFDSRSDPKVYSWYQILDPNQVDFVWAYAKTGSELDEALRAELNYGRISQQRIREFRGVIRLSNAPEFNDDEFAITELISNEWVRPNTTN